MYNILQSTITTIQLEITLATHQSTLMYEAIKMKGPKCAIMRIACYIIPV